MEVANARLSKTSVSVTPLLTTARRPHNGALEPGGAVGNW
jgi:hypothetical protein